MKANSASDPADNCRLLHKSVNLYAPLNSVKLIEGVDAMLLTSPSEVKDHLLLCPAHQFLRTKLGVASVVDRQQSPHDQDRHDPSNHDLSNDAPWIAADEMVQLQPVFQGNRIYISRCLHSPQRPFPFRTEILNRRL